MLRPYQKKAKDLFYRHKERCIIVLPTGAGKTIIALDIIKEKCYSALIIVPTIELLKQWSIKLKNFGLDNVCSYYSDEKSFCKITITTYVSALKKEVLKKINSYDIVVLDEAHNLVRYKELIKHLKGKVLGLTATPNDFLEEFFDVVRVEITEELISKGYLADYEYIPVKVKLNREKFNTPYLSINNYTLERVKKILDTIGDEKCIIFIKTKHEAAILGYLLCIPVITSKVPKYIRKELLNKFKTGEIKRLISAKVLEEGIDIGDVENILIVSGFGSNREFIQRIGRALRPKPRARIWEIYYSKKRKLLEKRFGWEF